MKDILEEDENRKVRAKHSRNRTYEKQFILDSACTQHITNYIINCTKIQEIKPIRVHISENTAIEAKQEGMVQIKPIAGTAGKRRAKLALSRVFHVTDAFVNILSCLKLDIVLISPVIQDG